MIKNFWGWYNKVGRAQLTVEITGKVTSGIKAKETVDIHTPTAGVNRCRQIRLLPSNSLAPRCPANASCTPCTRAFSQCIHCPSNYSLGLLSARAHGQELATRGYCPGNWKWIIPPVSSSQSRCYLELNKMTEYSLKPGNCYVELAGN